MMHMFRRIVFALFVATLPLAAVAQQVFTLRDVDVFAGPSSEYPPVAELAPGTPVQLAGCLSDWSWCDVIFANDRGWVYAGDLGYPYQGNRVVIIEYGPRLQLPVVTFSLQTYWSAHYTSRQFFRERDVWISRVRVEGSRGGPPPHGRQAQGRPEGGGGQAAQPAQPAQPQAAQPAQPSDQARRAQPAQPQGRETMRPEERAAKQPQRPQPEAGQAPHEQREQRARPPEESPAPQGRREQPQQQQQQMQAPQGGEAARAGRQPEGMRAPQGGEAARAGRQPEGMQAPQGGEATKAGRQPEGQRAPEADKAKQPEGKRERPKEEGQ